MPHKSAIPTFRLQLADARRGWTLVEVLVAIGIISILLSLVMPAVQRAHSSAQRLKCQNNLRQIGTALANYESRHSTYPLTWHGRVGPYIGRYSVQASLLPDLGNQAVYDSINFIGYPSYDIIRNPRRENTTVAGTSIAVFLCPADGEPRYAGYGGINYRCNFGPTEFRRFGEHLRPTLLQGVGAFVPGRSLRASDFVSGLANTVVFAEKARGAGGATFRPFIGIRQSKVRWSSIDEIVVACRQIAQDDIPFENVVGYSWFLPNLRNGAYNHNVPPNSSLPDCAGGVGDSVDNPFSGSFASRSYHGAGANALFGDGRVEFVSGSMDLKVWREMGKR